MQPVGFEFFQVSTYAHACCAVVGNFVGTLGDLLKGLREIGGRGCDLASGIIIAELGACQAYIAGEQGSQATIQGARREWCDRKRLHLLVEGGVVMFKLLVVREIARSRAVADDAN